jgi:HAD superfamily hydrolase (TIGR01509 family)
MIKLVLFDLDGVLIDAKKIHYDALNEALGPEYEIDMEEHLSVYDGLKTTQKLEMLTERKGLPAERYEEISEEKQRRTRRYFQDLQPIREINKLFQTLETEGFKIGVCSNSIRRSVLTALSKTKLIEHCSVILSNEDVHNSKPHPEMYWKAMSMMGCLPEETLIVEDSPPGLLAAQRSRANYVRVDNPHDVTRKKIFDNLKGRKLMPKWTDKKLNVLIPMAGAGSRFAAAGYTFPKPLIDVNGKPMIQLVVENLGLVANYHFVVQKEHREKYNLDAMLGLIAPGCQVIEVDGITEGAACTALMAREFIDNDNPLFFANSDQYVEWNVMEFMYAMNEKDADGGIVTFEATHPKWSFAKTDDSGKVIEVAEKNPISNQATVGYYYWKKGSDFCKYADQMIDRNVRVNNEFYVCPVFNQAIEDGKIIRTHTASAMWGLGTPEDLEYFIKEK